VRDPLASARLTRPNQEWAMDFIVDGLANGRMIRILMTCSPGSAQN
jgi:hypothetical protein